MLEPPINSWQRRTGVHARRVDHRRWCTRVTNWGARSVHDQDRTDRGAGRKQARVHSQLALNLDAPLPPYLLCSTRARRSPYDATYSPPARTIDSAIQSLQADRSRWTPKHAAVWELWKTRKWTHGEAACIRCVQGAPPHRLADCSRAIADLAIVLASHYPLQSLASCCTTRCMALFLAVSTRFIFDYHLRRLTTFLTAEHLMFAPGVSCHGLPVSALSARYVIRNLME